jgi:predicted  nucleic acid-binding Zn-ribbon protein
MTTPALGKLAKDLQTIKAEISAKNAELKTIQAEKEDLELQIREQMNAIGIEQLRIDTATITIGTQDVPQITDFEELWKYVHEYNKPYLLERRVSSSAWRDELKSRDGEAVPGTETFTKHTVSLRTR